MFEDLFIDRGTIAHYRCEPLLEERLSYLRHCAQEGARPLTLRTIAATQITLIRLLDLRAGERVSVPRIEAAADRRSSQPAQPSVRRIFVSRAVRWLRFAGLLDEPAVGDGNGTPTSPRSRSSGSGCAKSADGPR